MKKQFKDHINYLTEELGKREQQIYLYKGVIGFLIALIIALIIM